MKITQLDSESDESLSPLTWFDDDGLLFVFRLGDDPPPWFNALEWSTEFELE